MLLVDSREPKYFKERLSDADWEIDTLDVGDYVINNIIIERKEVDDLYNAIISKRHFNQINKLLSVREDDPEVKIIYIIEGTNYSFSWNGKKKKYNNKKVGIIAGALSSMVTKHNITVLPSPNKSFTLKLLKLMAKKISETGGKHDKYYFSSINRHPYSVRMLSSVDGIGVKKAYMISEAIAKENNKTTEELTVKDIMEFFENPSPIIGIGISSFYKVKRVLGI